MQKYYAHGKLLLTAEYFVLDGAPALAIPTRFGQSLEVRSWSHLEWDSFTHADICWFEGEWERVADGFKLQKTNDTATAERLAQLLASIQRQHPAAAAQLAEESLSFFLDFPRDWGLGSSSTMISLLAQHLAVNPYQLLADSFGGSGYDLACATADGPLVYERNDPLAPTVTRVDWAPAYAAQLYFVHLGQKQNSREGIRYYRELGGTQATLIDDVAALTNALLDAKSWEDASRVADEHEHFISTVLQMERVQTERFADFPGVIKSLGAWGGDFVMVFTPWPAEKTCAYFNQQGYSTVLAYEQMILQDA